jgi:hypothetical protein
MPWHPVEPNNGNDRLAAELSLHIDCVVRFAPYSNYAKPMLECYCGIPFLVVSVKGAMQSGDWSLIEQRHKGGL